MELIDKQELLDSKQILKNTVVDLQKTFESKLEPEYIEKYIKATAEWLDDVSKWSINYVDFVDSYLSGYGSGDMWYDFARYGKFPFHFNRYEEVFSHISPLTNYGDTRCQFIEEELSTDNIQNEDLKEDFLDLVDKFENEYYEAIQRNKIGAYIYDLNTTLGDINKVYNQIIDDLFDMPSIDEKLFEELHGCEEYVLKNYIEECVLDEVPSAKPLIESDNFLEEFRENTSYFYSCFEEVLHEAIEELNLHAWKSGYCYKNEFDYYFELTPELESKIVDKFKEIKSDYHYSVDLYDIADIMQEVPGEEYWCDILKQISFTPTLAKESLKNKEKWEKLADKLTQAANEYDQENDYIM